MIKQFVPITNGHSIFCRIFTGVHISGVFGGYLLICQALVSIAASEGPAFADLCRGNAKLREAHAWFGGPRIKEQQIGAFLS